MKYDLNHDSLLDSMLLAYLTYCMKDGSLDAEALWVRVTDAMQHLSQQAIAEFIIAHLDGCSYYSRIWDLRQAMYKREAEAEEYERKAEVAGAWEREEPPPEKDDEERLLWTITKAWDKDNE